MAEMYLKKGPAALYPADDDAMELLAKIKTGDVILCKFTRPRNYEFHKKLFELTKLGFDAWEPPEVTFRGHQVQKNFKKFRSDITVAAGYFTPSINLKGEVQAIPDSWAFGNMDQETFEKMYSAIVDVLLQDVLASYTRDDIDRVVDEILSFT